MSFSRIVFFACLAFIAGIFAASLFQFPKPILLGFFVFALLFFAASFLRYKFAAVLVVLLVFFVLGVWRYQLAEQKVFESRLLELNDSGETITLIGQVVAEPDIRDTNIKLEIMPESIVGSGSTMLGGGKVLVTVPRYPEYSYGDKLQVTGKLQSPAEFDDFNYRDYLKKDGIYSVMYWPEVEIIAKSQGNFVYAKILEVKNKLRMVVYQNLSPPQSAILGAIILGDKRKISDEWKTKLNIAGVRHITAISGMHVAILTQIVMGVLIALGLWRQQAFYLTVALIAVFIVMTGLQPSAVRAGIMGWLLLLAQHLGRINASSRAVVFAATLMLVLNPFLLRLDVGFQLSFLAVIGIIYLAPIFGYWLRKIPETLQLKSISIMTFSAYAFTAPILIYNFGYISLVGLLTNLLIVPLLWLVMVSGFMFALAGVIWQPLGQILSWPSWLLLTYITKLVEWSSGVPLASLTLEHVHWIWPSLTYAILGYITWRLNQQQKLKFLG